MDAGSYRVEYEDVLRAIGNYLDANFFRYITVVETPDGFLIKGATLETSAAGAKLRSQTYLFTNDDIELVLEQALARRGSGVRPGTSELRSPSRYENSLRAIGRQVDDEKLHDIVIMQVENGLRVKSMTRPDAMARDAGPMLERLFTDGDLDGMIEDMLAGRRGKSAMENRAKRWPF